MYTDGGVEASVHHQDEDIMSAERIGSLLLCKSLLFLPNSMSCTDCTMSARCQYSRKCRH